MFLDTLWQATLVVSNPFNLLIILLGTTVGIIVGAIPGIGPALGVALALPFTYRMETIPALLFLVALYDGGMYGGSISAVLINTPGTGSAAATTIEGFPMAKQGKAITALSITATASALGGLIGDIIAVSTSAFMLSFVLLFGTPEFFLLGIFGILLVSLVSTGAFYKGLISVSPAFAQQISATLSASWNCMTELLSFRSASVFLELQPWLSFLGKARSKFRLPSHCWGVESMESLLH